ncbi:MAG: hypothetical protein LBI14_10240 [Treponema sp.]|jgi:hypothetical protein|nr:hypothetical protein [Treponema sp.]
MVPTVLFTLSALSFVIVILYSVIKLFTIIRKKIKDKKLLAQLKNKELRYHDFLYLLNKLDYDTLRLHVSDILEYHNTLPPFDKYGKHIIYKLLPLLANNEAEEKKLVISFPAELCIDNKIIDFTRCLIKRFDGPIKFALFTDLPPTLKYNDNIIYEVLPFLDIDSTQQMLSTLPSAFQNDESYIRNSILSFQRNCNKNGLLLYYKWLPQKSKDLHEDLFIESLNNRDKLSLYDIPRIFRQNKKIVSLLLKSYLYYADFNMLLIFYTSLPTRLKTDDKIIELAAIALSLSLSEYFDIALLSKLPLKFILYENVAYNILSCIASCNKSEMMPYYYSLPLELQYNVKIICLVLDNSNKWPELLPYYHSLPLELQYNIEIICSTLGSLDRNQQYSFLSSLPEKLIDNDVFYTFFHTLHIDYIKEEIIDWPEMGHIESVFIPGDGCVHDNEEAYTYGVDRYEDHYVIDCHKESHYEIVGIRVNLDAVKGLKRTLVSKRKQIDIYKNTYLSSLAKEYKTVYTY